MVKVFNRFLREEDGAGLVEYTLILALVAVGCATVLTGLGTKITTLLGSVTTAL